MQDMINFIGLNTHYPIADGSRLTRLHLDGAASPLAAETARLAIDGLLPHYSNSHSYVHNSAQISTQAQQWAHDTILKILKADPRVYTAIFSGSGTTASINRVARGLASSREGRGTVLVSSMEHHANDLPHRQFNNNVYYIPLSGSGAEQGQVDLAAFAQLCEKHTATLNYAAVSAVSNVTGIRNPIAEMQKICHQHGGLLLVDAAQSVAHEVNNIDALDADFFVFSGHKLYTPMSPGVLIAKKALLSEMSGQDLGGGSVADVSLYDYQLSANYPDKEQSGTPNIVGAFALAKVMQELDSLDFVQIEKHDSRLMTQLFEGLSKLKQITVYGDPQLARVGALAFNHADIDHGLFAAILNDYYAIAVRNECFCAHPYVSSLLKEQLWQLDLSEIETSQQQAFINQKRGMVRASVSLYNTDSDIDRLLSAIGDIDKNIDKYRQHYVANEDGSFTHDSFRVNWMKELGLNF